MECRHHTYTTTNSHPLCISNVFGETNRHVLFLLLQLGLKPNQGIDGADQCDRRGSDWGEQGTTAALMRVAGIMNGVLSKGWPAHSDSTVSVWLVCCCCLTQASSHSALQKIAFVVVSVLSKYLHYYVHT